MPDPVSVYAWYVMVCLAANPTSCREIKISIPNASELVCNYQGLPLTNEYLRDNEPDYDKLKIRTLDCRDRVKHPRKTAVAEPKE